MRVLFQGTGYYPTGLEIGPACWPHWDLLTVTRGRVSIQTARRRFGRSVVMDEGSVVLLPPGIRFRGRGQTPQATIWVAHFEDQSEGISKTVRYFHQAAGDAFSRGLLTEIANVFHSSTNSSKDPYLSALVIALLAKVMQANRLKQNTVKITARLKLCRVEDLEACPGTPFPTVADLATAAGLSVSHHRALFCEQFGLSPGRHLLQLRMVYARKLLRETRLPIKQVASYSGYKDVVSFHRAFVKTCGITPGKFRTERPSVV